MTDLSAEIDTAIGQAVTGLRGFGYSWADIGTRLGITRQAAQQRWGSRHDHRRDRRSQPRTFDRARGWGRPPTTPPKPSPGPTSASGNASSPPPACAPTPSAWLAGSRPSTGPRARSPRSTTPPANPGACCTSRAATAAKPSARPARPSTSATPGSSSARAWPAARASPRRSPAHPCVFATLTAPSFGPVHSRRMRGKTILPCRPRRDAHARRCPHGHDISCPTRHVEDDPRLGQPLCFDCYDYEAAVLFNAYAGDLWRRFTTYLPRHLARLAGVTQKELRSVLRIRYVKVAEYQARGVVHFHAVIRLDAPGEDYQPPPARYTAALLCDAIGQAATAATVVTGSGVRLGFGPQTDARPIRHSQRPARHRAGPVRPGGGQLHRQVRHQDPDRARRPGHPYPHRLRPSGPALLPPLPGDDHALPGSSAAGRRPANRGSGNGRTCSATAATSSPNPAATPSPSASSRAARTVHRRAQRHPGGERDPWGRPLDETVVLVLSTWTYAGTGYTARSPALSWRSRRPTWHVAARAIGGLPSIRS